MTEILGSNLEQFFKNSGLKAKCTYKQDKPLWEYGEIYEVWEVDRKTFKIMDSMSEDKFKSYYSNDDDAFDAWWCGRDCDGLFASCMYFPDVTCVINGQKILAWQDKECETKTYRTLIDYLAQEMGATACSNVFALTYDLAIYNNMTLGELFEKYN